MEPSAESGSVGGPRDPLADITKDPRETQLRCKWVLGEVLVRVLQREKRATGLGGRQRGNSWLSRCSQQQQGCKGRSLHGDGDGPLSGSCVATTLGPLFLDLILGLSVSLGNRSSVALVIMQESLQTTL